MHEVEVFVIVDEDGAYTCSHDRDEVLTQANDDGLAVCRRLIRVVLQVPSPEAITVEATLPAESTETTVTVK